MQNFVYFFLISLTLCSHLNAESAKGRLFGNVYTSTVIVPQTITSLVPSSCVLVEPTLPPCRNVRYLKFPMFPGITINNTTRTNWRFEPQTKTTVLGWGEYLGLYAPTVTVTSTSIRVTTVQDPSVVVTFAVKGCRPLKVPMELDRCQIDRSSSIALEEKLQTTTVASAEFESTILPTKTVLAGSETTTFQDVNLLEASPQELNENSSIKPTETLP